MRANNTSGTTNADGGAWWSFTTAALPPGGGIVNGNFESGSTGWTVYSTHGLSVTTSASAPLSGQINGVAPNLHASTTQLKFGIVVPGEKS